MKIETRAFGTIEIDDDRVMKFVGPMLGFENAGPYALVDANPQGPFKIMQLVNDPDVSFLVTDPAVFFPDFTVQLSAEQVTDIGLSDPAKAAVMVVVNIRDGGAKLTANLKAPLVVNIDTFQGKQLVLKGTQFALDEPLPLATEQSAT